jgi:hypothetical protein
MEMAVNNSRVNSPPRNSPPPAVIHVDLFPHRGNYASDDANKNRPVDFKSGSRGDNLKTDHDSFKTARRETMFVESEHPNHRHGDNDPEELYYDSGLLNPYARGDAFPLRQSMAYSSARPRRRFRESFANQRPMSTVSLMTAADAVGGDINPILSDVPNGGLHAWLVVAGCASIAYVIVFLLQRVHCFVSYLL